MIFANERPFAAVASPRSSSLVSASSSPRRILALASRCGDHRSCGGLCMKKISFAFVVAGLMAAGPVLAQGMGGTGTAGGTQNTGPQGTGNFVSGKPGDPGAPTTGRSGTNTGGAGGAASSTSSGDMGNTNNRPALNWKRRGLPRRCRFASEEQVRCWVGRIAPYICHHPLVTSHRWQPPGQPGSASNATRLQEIFNAQSVFGGRHV